MMIELRRIGIVVGMLVCAGYAHAQDTTESLLQRFIDNPSYQAAVWDSARKQAAALPDRCATVKPADGNFWIAVVAPVSFAKKDGRLVPSEGAWVAHLNADVCGTRRQLNVLSIAGGNGAVDLQPLYRGTTLADPVLQRDASTSVIELANMLANGPRTQDCKSPVIVDTRFIAIEDKPQPGVQPGQNPYAWHEVWTVDLCGTPFEAAIDFVPDSTGTGFNVHAPRGAK